MERFDISEWHLQANKLHKEIFQERNTEMLVKCTAEEGAELQVAMFHYLKGRGSKDEILEEFIDQFIAGFALIDDLGITSEEFEQMYLLKSAKYLRKMKEGIASNHDKNRGGVA